MWKKDQTKHKLLWSSTSPEHKSCRERGLSCWGSPQGSGRELQGCLQVTFPRDEEVPSVTAPEHSPRELHPIPSTQGVTFQLGVEEFFPLIMMRKTGPKNFSTQAVTFLSPSSFRGTLAMENRIDAEPIAVSCDGCYFFSCLVLALQLVVYLDCHSWALLLFSWQSSW